jgi:3-methyl-2-oxobutanoate hydroxymethyltransferase
MSRVLINTLRTSSRRARILAQHTSSPISRATLSLGTIRWSSHSPLGSAPVNNRKPITINTLQTLYRKNEPITMITAHDFPSAHVADHAGMDMILVGDSLAMVALGMEDTSEVLMEEMLLHCKSVARATKGAFTVRSLHLSALFSSLTQYRSATSPWAPTKSPHHKPSNPQSR